MSSLAFTLFLIALLRSIKTTRQPNSSITMISAWAAPAQCFPQVDFIGDDSRMTVRLASQKCVIKVLHGIVNK